MFGASVCYGEIKFQRNCVFLYLRPWNFLKEITKSNGGSGKKYFMTFFVKSAAKYAERRFLLRKTWGSVDKIDDKK